MKRKLFAAAALQPLMAMLPMIARAAEEETVIVFREDRVSLAADAIKAILPGLWQGAGVIGCAVICGAGAIWASCRWGKGEKCLKQGKT